MALSKSQRLNLLFEDGELPPVPDQSKPHIADEAFTPKPQPHHDTDNVAKSPSTEENGAETNAAIHSLNASVPVPVSSEDEDDEYISAFVQKMKPVQEITSSKRKNKRKGRNSRILDETMKTGEKHAATSVLSGGDVSKSFHTPSSHHEVSTGQFCPLIAASRYPYKFVHRDSSDRVAKKFFDEGKFWALEWNIYYVHPPTSISHKPLLLVPAPQFQTLLDSINKALHGNLIIPSSEDDGFLLEFFDDGTPQPRFLGTSTSRDDKEFMESKISRQVLGEDEPPPGYSPVVDRSFAAFKKKMEAAVHATKNRSKAVKARKQRDHVLDQQSWCRQLKRTQRYLGLRGRRQHGIPNPALNPLLTWKEQQEAERVYAIETGTLLSPLNLEKPAPFPFDRDVVFVCVDVESYERDHNQITEIGVSTLDTRDLVGLAPGESGMNWRRQIRSRHFRVSERSYIVNKEFVEGCAEKFEFGISEWISIRSAAELVDTCFMPPYSFAFRHEGNSTQAVESDVQDETEQAKENGKSQDNELGLTGRDSEGAGDSDNKVSHNKAQVAEDLVVKGSATEPATESNDEMKPVILAVPANHIIVEGIGHRAKDIQVPAIVQDLQGNSMSGTISVHKADTTKGISTLEDGKATEDFTPSNPSTTEVRTIILLGHDTASDISYLRTLGSTIFKPNDPKNPLEAIDTAILFRVLKRENQTRSLANLLLDLNMTGWYLHNAGNDARYTMEAMISIAIKARLLESDPASAKNDPSEWKEEVELCVSEKIAETELRIREECEGWVVARNTPKSAGVDGTVEANIENDDDDIDGGVPVLIQLPVYGDGKRRGKVSVQRQERMRKEREKMGPQPSITLE